MAWNAEGIWVCMRDVIADICGMQADAIDFYWFAEVDVKVVCAANRNVSKKREASTARVGIHYVRNNTIHYKLRIPCTFG